MSCHSPFWLVPRQMGHESALWGMYVRQRHNNQLMFISTLVCENENDAILIKF